MKEEEITIRIKTPIRSGVERDYIKSTLRAVLEMRFAPDVIEIKSRAFLTKE